MNHSDISISHRYCLAGRSHSHSLFSAEGPLQSAADTLIPHNNSINSDKTVLTAKFVHHVTPYFQDLHRFVAKHKLIAKFL